MPIAKLVSSDGPISIYYELHGRISTVRDDLSVTNPCRRIEQTEGARQSSLSSASDTDPELGRIKHAIGSATAADKAANAGKRAVDKQRRLSSSSKPAINDSQPCSIEMTDMSARSRNGALNGKLSSAQNGFQASANEKPSVEANIVGRATKQKAMNGHSGTNEPKSCKEASANANGIREDEYIIEMPHEDADTDHARCHSSLYTCSCAVMFEYACIFLELHAHAAVC